MTLQLGLVGIYLKYIFHWNNFGINLLWFLFTAAVAGWTVTRQLKLSFKVIFPAVYIALCCGSLAVVLYFVWLVAGNSPANAALFVPIGGMVLGNSMRGNVIVIQSLMQKLDARRKNLLSKGSFLLALFLFQTFLSRFDSIGRPIESRQA